MSENSGRFKKFLLPEKEVSLKLVFDNARNYVIVGAFVAMARWFSLGKATAVPGVFTKAPTPENVQWLTWGCFGFGFVLFLLNVGQSYRIAETLLKDIFTVEKSVSGDGGELDASNYMVLVGIVGAAAFVSFMLLILAVYIVWFAAVGASK